LSATIISAWCVVPHPGMPRSFTPGDLTCRVLVCWRDAQRGPDSVHPATDGTGSMTSLAAAPQKPFAPVRRRRQVSLGRSMHGEWRSGKKKGRRVNRDGKSEGYVTPDFVRHFDRSDRGGDTVGVLRTNRRRSSTTISTYGVGPAEESEGGRIVAIGRPHDLATKPDCDRFLARGSSRRDAESLLNLREARAPGVRGQRCPAADRGEPAISPR
jgi:hypothetical protein